MGQPQTVSSTYFQGQKNDVAYQDLPINILTNVNQAILYRGKALRIPGYNLQYSGLTGAVQKIFPFQQFSGSVSSQTLALVVATEQKLYVLGSGGLQSATTKIDNGKNDAGANVELTTYGASSIPSQLMWSGVSFVGGTSLTLFYCCQYGYTPQVWNGSVTDGSLVAIPTITATLNPTTNFYDIKITKTGHSLINGQVIEVNGITTSSGTPPNGIYQIHVVDANNFVYQAASTATITFTANGNYWISSRFGNAIIPSSGFKAKVIRAYINHLVYMNVYDGTADQPFTWWRAQATPSVDPTCWQAGQFYDTPGYIGGSATATTYSGDAGYEADPDGGDKLVDVEKLNQYFVLYKDRSILMNQYTGTTGAYWDTVPTILNYGAYSTNAVCALGSIHYFMARDGQGLFDSFRYFDGVDCNEIESSKGIRDIVKKILDTSYPEAANSFYYPDYDVVMWLFPSTAAASLTSSQYYPDTAVLWNRSDDTWSFANLNFTDGSGNVHAILCASEYESAVSTTINGADGKVYALGTATSPITFTTTVAGGTPGKVWSPMLILIPTSGTHPSVGQWVQVTSVTLTESSLPTDVQSCFLGTFEVIYNKGFPNSVCLATEIDYTGSLGGGQNDTLVYQVINSNATITNAGPAPVGSSYWQGKSQMTLLGDTQGEVWYWNPLSTTFDSTTTRQPILMNVGRQYFKLDNEDGRKKVIMSASVWLNSANGGDVLSPCTAYLQMGYVSGGINKALSSASQALEGAIQYLPPLPINVVAGQNIYDVYFRTPPALLFSWNIYTQDTNPVPVIEKITFYYVSRGIANA